MCNWGGQVLKLAPILEASVCSILLVASKFEVSPLTLKRKGRMGSGVAGQVKSSQFIFKLTQNNN